MCCSIWLVFDLSIDLTVKWWMVPYVWCTNWTKQIWLTQLDTFVMSSNFIVWMYALQSVICVCVCVCVHACACIADIFTERIKLTDHCATNDCRNGRNCLPCTFAPKCQHNFFSKFQNNVRAPVKFVPHIFQKFQQKITQTFQTKKIFFLPRIHKHSFSYHPYHLYWSRLIQILFAQLIFFSLNKLKFVWS